MQTTDKKIIGIDPGCSGAIAVLDNNLGYVNHLLMPTFKTGKSSRVNGVEVAEFLKQYEIQHAFIEQVHAMPKQGVTSTFNFGHATGVIEGIIQGLSIPCSLVTPSEWKRSIKLIGTDKDASRSMCIRLYPEIRELGLKAKGQAIADALLIARYGIKEIL